MKRKPSRPKPGSRRKTKRKSRRRLSPELDMVVLPHVVGKKIDELIVSNCDDARGIDIFFEDESGVTFEFLPEIKLVAKEVDTKDNWCHITRWAKPKPYVGP
jgi:hypothetical protein